MRLIDADALNEKLCETTIFIKGGEIFQRMINNAPTIEPDGDTISRSQAIKGVSEWATDILHPDRLVKEDAIYILESLPSAEQITGKLNNPDGSLLTADSEACKEQKSKLDLISRQAAIRWVKTECNPYGKPTLDFESGKKVIEHLGQMPSAPDSRQRGEWVRLEREENVYDLHGVPTWGVNYMCDKCGFITTAIQGHFGQYRWCPSCGADMRKGGEDK